MAKGEFKKANATIWTNSQARKFTASAITQNTIKHANATTWFDNYPQVAATEEKYFNVVWTQPYNKSGVKLDAATWGDHPRAGDSVGFIGLFGFDRAAMQSFVGTSKILSIQLECLFIDPSHAGNPALTFGAHIYASKPNSSNWNDINNLYVVDSTFNQTGSNIVRWIHLPVAAWIGGSMGGVAVWAKSNTAANSARFAGKTSSHGVSAFNSRLYIKVER
jgi:hypothetical protein